MKILQTLAVTALLANANIAIAYPDHEDTNNPSNSSANAHKDSVKNEKSKPAQQESTKSSKN